MSVPNKNPAACAWCEICSLIWALAVFGTAYHLIVDLGWSQWWLLGALFLTVSWSCKLVCTGRTISEKGE